MATLLDIPNRGLTHTHGERGGEGERGMVNTS